MACRFRGPAFSKGGIQQGWLQSYDDWADFREGCRKKNCRETVSEAMTCKVVFIDKGLRVGSSRLMIVWAVLNERENLPGLYQQVRALLPSTELFVVDDNSSDGTGTWLAETQKQDPLLSFVIRLDERGLGSATLCGLRQALNSGFDFVATMDADGSHAPESLAAMWDQLMRAPESAPDVMIGSRYISGGGVVGWPWHRRVISRGVNLLTRILLGLRCRDNTGAFRIYSATALRKVNLSEIQSRGYGYLEELLFQLSRRGATIEEFPIVFRDRVAGKSKANWRQGLAVVSNLVRLSFQRFRPLRAKN